MQEAGDSRLHIILQKTYRLSGCFSCKSDQHTHHNCPRRPCYLCRETGHTSASCPFKPTNESIAKQRAELSSQQEHIYRPHTYIRQRELNPGVMAPPNIATHEKLRSARVVYVGRKLHAKRITAAEWLFDGTGIVSADKSGALRLWSLGDTFTDNCDFKLKNLPVNTVTTTYPHRCNVNEFVFDATNRNIMYSSSSDGTIVETRLDLISSGNDDASYIVENFNPDGWSNRNSWRMAYGLALDPSRHALYMGSDDGTMTRIDRRTTSTEYNCSRVSGKFHRDKITCISVNPVRPDLLATASNDRTVRLWDARKFMPTQSIGSFEHGGVVSAAIFSPNSGAKLLSTSLDNRIHVWNDVHALSGNANVYEDAKPTSIVHAHNFHRYITAFQAVWDPKDYTDDAFMCGRFLGDAYLDAGDDVEEAVKLHPIDLFSAKAGAAVHSLVDKSLPFICPVNKFHPVSDTILTTASGDLYIWRPARDGEANRTLRRRGSTDGPGHGGSDDDGGHNDDDDGDDGDAVGSKRYRKPVLTVARRSRRRTGRRSDDVVS